MAFHLDQLAIGECVISGKGAKSAPITSDGCPAVVTMEPMRVCFEPSAYGDAEASRVNIVWRPSDEAVEQLGELDEWVLQTVSKNALRFFGKAKSVDQLRETYSPIVKTSDKYPPNFKAKLNLQSPAMVKIWDAAKQPRAAPEQWKDCLTVPRLRLRGLYFMGAAQFGCVLECSDIQIVEEESPECPF